MRLVHETFDQEKIYTNIIHYISHTIFSILHNGDLARPLTSVTSSDDVGDLFFVFVSTFDFICHVKT